MAGAAARSFCFSTPAVKSCSFSRGGSFSSIADVHCEHQSQHSTQS
jgi:hypothetical protein